MRDEGLGIRQAEPVRQSEIVRQPLAVRQAEPVRGHGLGRRVYINRKLPMGLDSFRFESMCMCIDISFQAY